MITIYGKPNCPQCDQAKSLVHGTGQEFLYVELDVGQDQTDGRAYISRSDLLNLFPGARSVPQITVNGSAIGGLTELRKYLQENIHDRV
jgi:glutaredoxin